MLKITLLPIAATLALATLSLATLATGMVATTALAADKSSGEQQLAKLLANRVPGKPVSCIGILDAGDTTVIDKTAIVFGSGATLYVNRPAYPESLSSDDMLITKSWTDNLCRIDTVQLRDRATMMYQGFVTLEDFVPYTRPSKSAATPASTPSGTQ